MEQLWGMIRALQMIVLSVLIDIPIPAVCLLFFQGCIEIQNIDIMGGEELNEKILTLEETDPLNQNFEMFGFGDKTFMLNSGSYFLIQLLMLVHFFISIIMQRICTSYRDFKLAR